MFINLVIVIADAQPTVIPNVETVRSIVACSRSLALGVTPVKQ